eukprot:c8388_g1_i1.p1 GENE.c8388_g1_i1~~c8388_g1_i1.p1  ORF type:complete len:1176 (-),score=281.70 c8388_g1_i1:63-3590(-)
MGTLIELLALTVQGIEDVVLTDLCQTLVSLKTCSFLLGEEHTPIILKVPVLNFLLECYLRSESPIDPSLHATVFQTIYDLRITLDQCSSGSPDNFELATQAFIFVCEILTQFFNVTYGTLGEAVSSDLLLPVAQSMVKCIENLPLSRERQQIHKIKVAIRSITEKVPLVDASMFPDLTANVPESESEGDATSPRARADSHQRLDVSVTSVDHEDRSPVDFSLQVKEKLSYFTKLFRHKMGTRTEESTSHLEFMRLASVFMDDDPQGTALVPWEVTDPEQIKWEGGNLNTLILVNHVRHVTNDTNFKIQALNILQKLACYEDNQRDDEVTRQMSQDRLDKLGEYNCPGRVIDTMGATRMVLTMMVDPNHSTVLKDVLELGCSLLEFGNPSVQRRVYAFFHDESSFSYFATIRGLIRQGCDEVSLLKAHNQPILDDEVARPSTFTEQAHMKLLLRFIQLTCEGHNQKIQDYWRVQQLSRRSYDIVSEITEYLSFLQAEGIDGSLVYHTIQCLQTLTELMQGPCVGNQQNLATSKLPSICNKILQTPTFPGCTYEQEADIRSETIACICALLEGCRDAAIPLQLADALNFHNLFSYLQDVYEFAENAEEEEEDEVDEKLTAAMQAYVLILQMKEFVPHVNLLFQESLSEEVVEWYDEKAAVIEVDQEGELRRIYFVLPKTAESLTDDLKNRITWAVDRHDITTKLTDFVTFAGEMQFQMEHKLQLQKYLIARILTADLWSYWLKTIAIAMAFAINCLMLIAYVEPSETSLVITDIDSSTTRELQTAIILGLLLAIVEGLRFITLVMTDAKLIVQKQFRKSVRLLEFFDAHDLDEFSEKMHTTVPRKLLFYGLSLAILLTDSKFSFNFTMFLSAILGAAISPLFYCIHLVARPIEVNRDLQNVLKAVTLNIRSLVVTMVYSIFLVYLFGIWAFMSFQAHYVINDGLTPVTQNVCQDLLQCTIVTLHNGLRKTDVGDSLEGTFWGDPEFIAFMLIYWLIILTVMMNIIFGIIIDTFAELRAIKSRTESDINDTCFICNHDRQMFQHTKLKFDGHKKHEHNMWKYLLFIIYIKTKDKTSHTGPESYVASKLSRGDLSWFPIGKALSLHEHLKEEDAVKNRVFGVMQENKTRIDELADAQTKTASAINTLEAALTSLQEMVERNVNQQQQQQEQQGPREDQN